MTNEDRASQIAAMLVEAGWTPKADAPTELLREMSQRWPDLTSEEFSRGLKLVGEQATARDRESKKALKELKAVFRGGLHWSPKDIAILVLMLAFLGLLFVLAMRRISG